MRSEARLRRLSDYLSATGSSINLTFHDVISTSSVDTRSPYAVSLQTLRDITQWLDIHALAPRTRLYFDDSHRSFYDTVLGNVEVSTFEEVVVGVPVTSVGTKGRGDWSDLNAARERGVRVAPHGYSHVRLAAYDSNGVRQTSPLAGPYGDREPLAGEPLAENEVLFQLVESHEALGGNEFILPYGCYNETTLAINGRLGLYSHLATADFELDEGQLLRPRLLVKADDTVATISAVLLQAVERQ